MSEVLLALLAGISVVCALILTLGGTRGRETANPGWLLLAAASLGLTLHLLGYLLADAAWFAWAAVAVVLGGSLIVGFREWSLWDQGLLPRPTTRESVLETVLVIVGVIGATTLQPFLPGASRMALIVLTLIPLLMVRWALTRVGKWEQAGRV